MPEAALWFRLIEATEAAREGAPEGGVKPETGSPKAAFPDGSSNGGDAAIAVTLDGSPSPATPPAPKTPSRVAETVMLALMALGEDGPAGADPLLLRQILVSLRAAGFEAEARSMAVEAALAAGL